MPVSSHSRLWPNSSIITKNNRVGSCPALFVQYIHFRLRDLHNPIFVTLGIPGPWASSTSLAIPCIWTVGTRVVTSEYNFWSCKTVIPRGAVVTYGSRVLDGPVVWFEGLSILPPTASSSHTVTDLVQSLAKSDILQMINWQIHEGSCNSSVCDTLLLDQMVLGLSLTTMLKEDMALQLLWHRPQFVECAGITSCLSFCMEAIRNAHSVHSWS